MVRLRFILVAVVAFVFTSTHVFAQKMKTVEGEYTYHVPENVTLENAKRIALDRAKIQALADAFGTIVSQSNSTRVENSNGKSDVDFLSIGGSEVKGEWIETIGEPQYHIFYEQEMLVIKASVKGKAREITSSAIDLKVKVLCNGTDDKFESDTFNNGDDLYISFQSPASGYVAIYLIDADNSVFCLLPYRNQESGQFPVKANQRYVFFSIKDAPPELRPYVDEYTMTCSRSSETNQVYVIFSPQQFTKAVDTVSHSSLPRELGFDEFQKWLTKCRNKDKEIQFVQIHISIKNEKD